MSQQAQVDETIFISEGLMIKAQHKEGKLLRAIGTTVKAKIIEMNHIEVEKDGKFQYFEIGDNVRWMEVEQ